MTENNGYQSTVDKAREFYASKTESVFTSEERLSAENTELELTVSDLQTKLDAMTQSRDYAKQQYDELYDKWTWVQRYIQASIDREEWTDTELQEPFWEELAEKLGLELKQEREVTVTATWNLTIRSSKQFLSNWDFNFSIEPDNGLIDIISGEDNPDIDISE